MAVETKFTYPKSQTVTGNVNNDILRQELEDAGLSVPLNTVYQEGTDVIILLDGNATAADETAASGVVSAHTGEAFAQPPLTAFSEPEVSDDTGSEVEKVSLSTGPLQKGTYIVGWGLELATTTTTGTTVARGSLYVDKNAAGEVERSQHNVDIELWDSGMSGSLAFLAVAGDSYVFSLRFRRVGAASNAARAQRGRITLTKIGD